MTLRVAIVGAGIGGLTAALTLSPLADEITILERRTGFGEAGAGIQLSPNASRILIGLGLEGTLGRIGSEPDRIMVRDLRSGRALAEVGLGVAARERFGAPYLHVARSDLHTALLDVVRSRSNVRLRVGRTLSSIISGEASATVVSEMSNGGPERLEADLVVGADGLWSRTRGALGDDRLPVFSGYAALRSTVPADALPAGLRGNAGGLWLGRGRHVVHYPVASGRQVSIVAVERRPDQVQGWSTPENAERVRASFERAASDLRALIAAGEKWSNWSLFDLPVRSLGSGRVALLGDAGHPALPFAAQGGAMAIEDAAVLACELRRDGAVADAVDRYARLRLARTRRVQRQSRRNATAYHCSGPVAAIRNLTMRRLGPEGMTARFAWIYGWQPDSA